MAGYCAVLAVLLFVLQNNLYESAHEIIGFITCGLTSVNQLMDFLQVSCKQGILRLYIMLCLGSIETDSVISESCHKGTILQRN